MNTTRLRFWLNRELFGNQHPMGRTEKVAAWVSFFVFPGACVLWVLLMACGGAK